MNIALRLGAIVCGLVYLVVGLVWAYWIALLGLLIGALGFSLARWADRRERRETTPVPRSQRVLGAIARWINVVAFALSLIALVATSLRG